MVPTKSRNPAGFLVDVGGKCLLLDAGHGTIRRLTDSGRDIQDIDAVCLSHFHTDHCGDAFNLIHTRFVDDMYSRQPHRKLTYFCPDGTAKRFRLWRRICWPEPQESYPVEFREGARRARLADVAIEVFDVKHVPWFKSVGFIIRHGGRKLVYTGDIGSKHNFADIVARVRGADLLMIEATVGPRTPNHFTVEQILELADAAKVKRVLAVHIRPHRELAVARACRRDRRLILAQDGMKITL